MTPTITSPGLLSIWEDYWGKLTPDWSEVFLKDKRIQLILEYPDAWIHIAIEKYRKLDHILSYLIAAENESPKPKKYKSLSEVEKDPSVDRLIRNIQRERLNDPKIPDQDWWREN